MFRLATFAAVPVVLVAMCRSANANTVTPIYDDFSGPTLGTHWAKDMPSMLNRAIELDTVNDRLNITMQAHSNMWGTRADAPILWTQAPDGDFRAETHVMLNIQDNNVAGGLTVYGDGVNDDGERPNFSFALAHWGYTWDGFVVFHGLGNNNPPEIRVPATRGEAWLRLELDEDGGSGGVDRWTSYYKLAEDGPWTHVATLDRDVDRARVGIYGKTGTVESRTVAYTYFALVPEPSTFILLGVGAIGLVGYRWQRRKRA